MSSSLRRDQIAHLSRSHARTRSLTLYTATPSSEAHPTAANATATIRPTSTSQFICAPEPAAGQPQPCSSRATCAHRM